MAIDLTKYPLPDSEKNNSSANASQNTNSSSEDSKGAFRQKTLDSMGASPRIEENFEVEELSGWQYFVKSWKLYANFKGRARRKEYWNFILYSFLISLSLTLVDTLLGNSESILSLATLFAWANIIPGLASLVRRLHDVGRSGWWLLLYFTGIGIFVILYWLFQDSEPGRNMWGPNPKGR